MSSRGKAFPPRALGAGFDQLKQPVHRLFLSGTPPDPGAAKITMVGTRRASRQGERVAFALARDLAQAGVTVVSGMARGIDASAHRGALAGGGPTVAFLGCGLDQVQGAAPRRLAAEIQGNGALITEYPPETPAQRFTFVARNRLLAAYTPGTVVVEAGERSGALITAHMALDLGKMVWAVPGDVTRSNTRGSNQLIRDGALVALEPSDILIGLGLTTCSESPFEGSVPAGLDPDQERVARALAREGSLSLEALHRLTTVPVARLLRAVSALEVAGHVERGGGGLHLRQPSKSF